MIGSSPTVVHRGVNAGSDDDTMYALDADTGDKQWAFETNATVSSSPAVADGTGYFGSNDNNLYALE